MDTSNWPTTDDLFRNLPPPSELPLRIRLLLLWYWTKDSISLLISNTKYKLAGRKARVNHAPGKVPGNK